MSTVRPTRFRPTRWVRSALTALAIALALVTCADYTAFAATGHSFVLGRINKANAATVLKRTTSGTALNLVTTSPTSAPMTVNGRGVVTNLNADQLDGLDASAFARAGSGQETAYLVEKSVPSPASAVDFTLPVPDGSYEISYSVAAAGSPAGKSLECDVTLASGGIAVKRTANVTTLTSGLGSDGVSATGVLTKSGGRTLWLDCWESGGSFTTSSTTPIQVVLRPLDVVTAVAPG